VGAVLGAASSRQRHPPRTAESLADLVLPDEGKTLGHPAQLGGAMLIKPSGEIAWSHMSDDAGDNASPEEILEAIGGL
jgi:hypothetical protein